MLINQRNKTHPDKKPLQSLLKVSLQMSYEAHIYGSLLHNGGWSRITFINSTIGSLQNAAAVTDVNFCYNGLRARTHFCHR